MRVSALPEAKTHGAEPDSRGEATVATAASATAADRRHITPLRPRLRPDRVVLPDVLRGLAILAMLVAHGANSLMPELPRFIRMIEGGLNSLASPLFALVMGITAQLLLYRTPPSNRSLLFAQQTVRGLLLMLLGVWLASWGTWVAIVLGQLGLLLIVGALVLHLRSGWLIAISSAGILFSGLLNQWLAPGILQLVVAHPKSPGWWIAQWAVLDPSYRLTNLLPMFLLGALLMRFGLPSTPRFLGMSAVLGLLLILPRPLLERVSGNEHFAPSGSFIDSINDLGLVALSYAVFAALLSVAQPGAARPVRGVLLPLRACGTVALSLYVVQVALIAFWRWQGIGYNGNEPLIWLILVPGLMCGGVLWWRFIGIGPIEWVIGVCSGRYRFWGSSS